MRWWMVMGLVGTGSMTAAAQPATSVRAGARPLLERAEEIALARSAAPPGVSSAARVLILSDTGYLVADSGSNGVVCLVSRSWLHSLEPHCYDAEGAATILPIEMFRTVQRHRGRGEEEIGRDVATGLGSGRFRLPRRPALSYMLSSAQVLYDDAGKHVGPWRPHLMLFYPGLTNAELGLAAQPDMRVGMVSAEGTPEATLVVVVPQFVDPRPSEKR